MSTPSVFSEGSAFAERSIDKAEEEACEGECRSFQSSIGVPLSRASSSCDCVSLPGLTMSSTPFQTTQALHHHQQQHQQDEDEESSSPNGPFDPQDLQNAELLGDLFSISNDGFFRLLQENDPDLMHPHQSQIEGLSLEVPHSMLADSIALEASSFSTSFMDAINLASSVQPKDKTLSAALQPVVAVNAALDEKRVVGKSSKIKFESLGAGSKRFTRKRSNTQIYDGSGSDSSDASSKKKKLAYKKPQREAFDSEEAFSAAWSQWRTIRAKNNAAVHRSREKARAKKAIDRQTQREKERKVAQMAMEAEILRKNVEVLLRALREPQTLSSIEQAWVQTLSHSNAGQTLANLLPP